MVPRVLLLLASLGLLLAALPVDAGHTAPPYLGKRCDVDVQLVIDTSGSMGGTDGGSTTRMDNAKAGADWFVSQLRTPEDYSGLTDFNSVSTLDKTVDTNHGPKTVVGTTAYYIDQLAASGGTTMAPAIQLAHNDLIGNGRPATSMQYIILLGDGPPGDQAQATTNANNAKAAGILIHTIQIGSTLSPAFMQGMASSPPSKYYHYAAGAQDVVGAFQDIMLEIVDCAPKVDNFVFTPQCSGTASTLALAANATGTVDVHQLVIKWGDGANTKVSYPTAGAFVTTPHVYANPGWYTINVTIEDTGNRAGFYEETVYVFGCPVADFTCYTSKNPYLRILFSDLSTDPDSDIAARDWTFGDGRSATTLSTSTYHDYAALGYYNVTLTVTDAYSNTDSHTETCFADLNRAPIIDPIPHQVAYEGETITFTVTGYDPDGHATYFQWQPVGMPGNVEFNVHTQFFEWTIVGGQAGDYGPLPFAICDFEYCDWTNATFEIRPARAGQEPSNLDSDGDGVPDSHDPYPYDPTNGEGTEDTDDDGVANSRDNCPDHPNPGQQDIDGDGIGDACDAVADGPTGNDAPEETPQPASDQDQDGATDSTDNCLTVANPDQADLDSDGIGDLCDADIDGDRVNDFAADGTQLDNCPRIPNPNQEDADGDGLGDACDAEPAVKNPVKVDPETGVLVLDVTPEAAPVDDVAQVSSAGGVRVGLVAALGAVAAALVVAFVVLRKR